MNALAEDVETVILGSGALSYPWYGDVDVSNTDDGGWLLTFREMYDEKQLSEYAITHHKMAHTMRMIADNADGASLSDDIRENCRLFIEEGWQETDFDADAADQVIQVAAFGKVVYG